MTAEADRATDPGEFKDRSGRLIVFGILAVGLGLLSVALGLLQVVMLFARRVLPAAENLPTDGASLASGAVLYGLIGLAFGWLGVGSVRKRRWVRPLMLTLAWTWLAGGLLAAFLVPAMIDMLALTAPDPETAGLFEVAKLLVQLFVAGFGILLPAAFVWVYRDRDLLRTCEVSDPGPAWTERCPTPVLGLSVGLGACAVLSLPMLARPVVPFFGLLLTGWPAALVLLLGALVCAVLARSTFRLEPVGWWGAVLLLALLGLATGISFVTLEPLEVQQALGLADSQAVRSEGPGILGGWLATVIVVIFTAASLLYLAGIRKYFAPRDSG